MAITLHFFKITFRSIIFLFLLSFSTITSQQLSYYGTNSYNLETPLGDPSYVYTSSFSVVAQDASPKAIVFNSDGSKMYMIGTNSDAIYQYTLTTSYDITTASYVSNFSVAAQESTPQGMAFNSDGSKMYVLGSSSDAIHQYTLTTSYDITTASYVSNFSIAAQEALSQGIVFNADGSKVYVTGGAGDDINQYNLTTSYDITTASYVSNFSVAAQETYPTGLTFNSDGSQMYMVGNISDTIHQYTLSTAYDVTTASYVSNFSVAAQDNNASGVAFNADGSKLYMVGVENDRIQTYDITHKNFQEALVNDGSIDNTSALLEISLDNDTFQDLDNDNLLDIGTEVTIGNVPAGLTPVLTLSNGDTYLTLSFTGTATSHKDVDDISDLTFVFDNTAFTGGDASVVQFSGSSGAYSTNIGVDFSDKSQLNYYGTNSYNLLTPSGNPSYSFSSSFSVAAQENYADEIEFNDDGSQMYVIGSSGDAINQYNLTTSYDITTASYVTSFSILAQENFSTGMSFNNDGSQMYVVGTGGDAIFQYNLTVAYDITTASYVSNFSVAAQEINPTGVVFNYNGSQMYVIGNIGDAINQYNLTTSYDITTASYISSFSVATQEINPLGMTFNNDGGNKMYVVGSSGYVNQYNLTVAYDITTASYVGNFSVATQEGYVRGISFNNEGSKLYVIGSEYDKIQAYDITHEDFEEAVANDGSIDNTSALLEINLENETFQDLDGDNLLDVGTEVTIGNVPAGLTPILTLSNGDTYLTLSFTGTATSHKDVDDISDLTFVFDNTAFISGNASGIQFSGSSGAYSTNIGVDFINTNSPQLSYYGTNSYNLETPLGNPSFSFSSSFSVAAHESTPYGMAFNNDGSKMYVIGTSGNAVNQYNLTTAYDITTASYISSFSVAAQETNSTGMAFNNNGSKMYVVGTFGDDVNQYYLTTAYDITTASYISSFSVAAQESNPLGMVFNNDGSQMYVIGSSGDDVNQYNLTVAYDITTASYISNFSIASQETSPMGMVFNYDGSKMYVIGSSGDVYQYSLIVAYDVTTASYINKFISGNLTSGFAFSKDGNQLYMMSFTGDEIHAYDITHEDFEEAVANDGSIDNTSALLEINLENETFQDLDGDNLLDVGTEVTIGNVPAGLTPILTLSNGDTYLTLSFTGTATNHQDVDDISDLTFVFGNTAFTGGDASIVQYSGSTGAYSTNIGIDFSSNPDPTHINTTIVATSPVVADGADTSVVLVQLSDINGNLLTSSGGTVTLSSTGSAVVSAVTDNGDGSYSATVTNTVSEVVTISGALDGTAITDTASVLYLLDTDGDGLYDYIDLDDDNDGISDKIEGLTNLIINGSFEIDDFADTTLYPNGFTEANGTFIGATYNNNTLTGWNYTQNLDGWVWYDGYVFAPAHHGIQYLDVVGNTNVTGGVPNEIFQVINTIPGQSYKFSFLWGEDIGHLVDDIVTLNAYVIDSNNSPIINRTLTTIAVGKIAGVGGPNNWLYFEEAFIATTTQTTIKIGAIPPGSGNTYSGAALDLVSVVKTSEIIDTDGDGIPNYLDADSDNDGCNDTDEVYGAGTDSDGNGFFGSGIPVVDGNGFVIGAGITPGLDYNTLPSDNDLNGIDDYLQESIAAIGITIQPISKTTGLGNVTFNVVAATSGTGVIEQYQWQEQLNGSGSWNNITNGGVYSGATTAVLTINVLNSSLNSSLYRAVISTPSYVCDVDQITEAALLTVTSNLEANADSGTILEGISGIAVVDVLANDNLSDSVPTTATVILTEISSTNTGITLDTATGMVNVAGTTPVGIYTLEYQICETFYLSNCSSATVTITVLADNDGDGISDIVDTDDDNDGNPDDTDHFPLTATAIDDSFIVLFNDVGVMDILENDDYIPSSNISIAQIGGSAMGGVTFDSMKGEMSYVPDISEAGTVVTVEYEVCFAIAIGDSAPGSCATAVVTITIPESSDLVLDKTVDNTTPNVGENVIFTIMLANNGPNTATSINVVDQLPSGYTYVSDVASVGVYDSVTGSWIVGSIANGLNETLTITARVNSSGNYTNSAEVVFVDQADPNSVPGNGDPSENDQDVATTFPVSITDLITTKLVDNSTPNIGDTISYTITVVNNGPSDATEVSLTDNLPVGVTYLSHLAIGGSINTYTGGLWEIGEISSGSSAILTISAIVNSDQGGTTIINTVTAALGNEVDLTNVGDDLTETITVTSSDLITTKVVSDSTPNEGNIITYTLTVTNNGPSDATSVSLTDNLPVGVTYVSDDSLGAFNNGSGLWAIGDLANGETATLNIVAMVDVGTAGQTITNVSTAGLGAQSDPDTTTDDLEESIIVNNSTDIVLTKVVDNSVPNEGDTITYTITVTNNGLAEVTNLVVTDVLPVGLSYGLVIPSVGIWSSSSWMVGTLASGVTETVTIEALVGVGTGGSSLTNTVSHMQDQVDDNTTLDDLTETITVTSSDLVTTKVVSDSTPNEGDIITYTLTVTNNGPSDATSISLTDNLPVGVTYVSDDSLGAFNNGSGLWVIGDLANGETAMLSIDVRVDSATADQTITNTTSIVTAAQSDPDITNNIGSVAIVPVAFIDLSLTKTVLNDETTPLVGDEIIFEIQVMNQGPTEASGVQVIDLLPTGYKFKFFSSSRGNYDSFSGVWDIDVVEIGKTEVLLIHVTVLESGDYINCAEVIAADQEDVDSTPNNGDDNEDDYGCASLITPISTVYPELFTPNGDGINEVFDLEFIKVSYPNFSMEIVNRYGNKVYEYSHNGNPNDAAQWWDGRLNYGSKELPTGTYFYTVYYNDSKQSTPKTGWIYLRR